MFRNIPKMHDVTVTKKCHFAPNKTLIFMLTHSPVVIFSQLYQSSVFKELLNDGTILFL